MFVNVFRDVRILEMSTFVCVFCPFARPEPAAGSGAPAGGGVALQPSGCLVQEAADVLAALKQPMLFTSKGSNLVGLRRRG